jgi:hypothetical protein
MSQYTYTKAHSHDRKLLQLSLSISHGKHTRVWNLVAHSKGFGEKPAEKGIWI